MTIEQILYLQHLSNWILIPSLILLIISVFSTIFLWATSFETYEPKEHSRMKTLAIITTIFACLCLIAVVIGFVLRANASYLYDLWKYNNPNLLPIV